MWWLTHSFLSGTQLINNKDIYFLQFSRSSMAGIGSKVIYSSNGLSHLWFWVEVQPMAKCLLHSSSVLIRQQLFYIAVLLLTHNEIMTDFANRGPSLHVPKGYFVHSASSEVSFRLSLKKMGLKTEHV